MQRRAAAQRSRLAVALQLDRPSLGQRADVLLALTTLDAVDHHVLQTTPVNARRIGPLEGQLAHRSPVAPGVATQRRSPPAGNPLQHWDFQSAPGRIRTSDLRLRSRRVRPGFGSIGPSMLRKLAKNSPETLRSSSSARHRAQSTQTDERRSRPGRSGLADRGRLARWSGAPPPSRVRVPGRQLAADVSDQGVDELADVGEQVGPPLGRGALVGQASEHCRVGQLAIRHIG